MALEIEGLCGWVVEMIQKHTSKTTHPRTNIRILPFCGHSDFKVFEPRSMLKIELAGQLMAPKTLDDTLHAWI